MGKIREIEITGNNWNEIIKLPCFSAIEKKGGKFGIPVSYWVVIEPDMHIYSRTEAGFMVSVFLVAEERKASKALLNEAQRLASECRATVGDKLIEYDDNRWQILRKE
jgi:hypothetical protein